MFTKKITESDAFLDMPSSTQALYFHLNMVADDDGFVNNPKKIQRMVGSGDDDMKLLIAKRFIIVFESGIIVIKHWKMHNYIQNDRYKPTDYVEEKEMLTLKKNKAYTLNVSNLDTKCIQNVSVGKVRLGKVRLDKDSIDDVVIDKRKETPESFYNNNIAPITQFVADDILNFINDGFEESFILRMMQEAVKNEKRNWKYISTSLFNNGSKGIKTLEEYEANETKRDRDKINNKPISMQTSTKYKDMSDYDPEE